MEKKKIIILTAEEEEAKKKKKADATEVDRRVYLISLMLRRKPNSFILQYASEKWKIGDRQTRTYIRKARKNWEKYSEKSFANAKAYCLAKLRDINDMAHDKKVVVGTVNNKKIKQVADLNLILDIAKEEAKLLGIYPDGEGGIPLDITIKVELTE